ncbi:MAG: N-acetyltransferase family protein [Brevinematales bacterium]|jgi:phosphinothricin acetyltransferase
MIENSPVSGPSYRDANPGDLPFIVEIYNSVMPGCLVTADTEAVTPESRVKWFNEHDPRSRPLWILSYKTRECGWLSFQDFYGRPAYRATAEISLYLHENFRNKGLGGKFLRLAIKESPGFGIKTLLAFIFDHNEISLNLFLKSGFRRWGLLPGIADMKGVERDLAILGKRVD